MLTLFSKRVLLFAFIFICSVHGISQTPRSLPPAYTNPVINYVRTWDAVAPETNSNNLTIATTIDKARMTTQYIDGLGRPLQTVAKEGSMVTGTAATDMVSAVEYDEFGREQFKYLPFVSGSNNGLFKTDPFQQQAAFMASQYGGQGETFFYGQTQFENSPLNRATKSLAPGNSWTGAGRGVEMKYWINTLADDVKIWTVTDNATIGVFGTYAIAANPYPAGELFKNVTVDEHGKQVIEFKDKEGKVILKKVQFAAIADDGTGKGHDGWLCTYYIYDDLNNLRCVIQPRGVELLLENAWNISALNNDILNEQCFRYEYDARNRMIVKKVPGAGDVYMVYDARDRLFLTQDASQRWNGQWLYTKYDALNRPVMTGIYFYWGTLQQAMDLARDYFPFAYEEEVVGDPNGVGYTSRCWPEASIDILTITHYDNYNTLPVDLSSSLVNSGYDNYTFNSYNASPEYAQEIKASSLLKGMVTWTKTKILNTTQWLAQANIYDDKGRLIQVQSINQTGGVDVITTQYDFSGKVLVTHFMHQKSGTSPFSVHVATKNGYDDLGRVIKTEKNLNNTGWKTLSSISYDALGQLKSKKLAPQFNSGAGLETLAYDYNIRGWVLGMNRDYMRDQSAPNYKGSYFGFELGYDKYTSVASTGGGGFWFTQFNGNITGTIWKSKGDQVRRKYDFEYDNANRFGKGTFTQNTNAGGGGAWNATDADFSVHGFDADNNWMMKYDANGNILSMIQKGFKIGTPAALVDALRYEYNTNSNKLKKVTDDGNDKDSKLGDFKYDPATKTSVDYGYDLNGNLATDQNKGITSITYNHLNLPQTITIPGKGSIDYVYDAGGNKLKKVVHETSKPDKTTLYLFGIYEDDVLQFLPQEEGRIRPLRDAGNTITGFTYDYFIKDHLGNVRMVLTEEQQTDIYPAATLEGSLTTDGSPNAAFKEKDFYTIDPVKVVDKAEAIGITEYENNNVIQNPNPNSEVTESSQKLYKLQATTSGGETGLGITLKVMSGDKIDVFGKSYYFENNSAQSNYSIPFTSIVNGLFGAPGSTAGLKGATAGAINSLPVITNDIDDFLSDPDRGSGTIPKAYINWILLDEQFNFVAGNFSRVGTANLVKDHYNDPQLQNIPVTKNGYLYVYVSNESPVRVFFDNLQVVHTRGPILEETHYYPFGLTMAGISSKAAGVLENRKQKFQGQEFASKEFSDGSGLEMYEFKWRMDDPQTGRFWQGDPLADKYVYNSPYAFSENKVTVHRELEGLEAEYIFGKAKQELANMFQGAANWIDNTFSAGSRTKIETPITSSVGSASNTLTVESTTSASTNSSPFMSFVIQNNTSNGYAGDYFKTTTTTTASVGTKINIKTPVASGSLSASTDQSGKTTVSGTGSVKTGSGLNVGVNTSTSSDGTQKIGGSVSVVSGSTTGKAGLTVSTNGKTSSVETSVNAEQKISNTKVTQTFFFKIKW